MDRISKNTFMHRTLLYSAKYGEPGSTPIDQQPVASFNVDPCTGRPISDMTAILRAQGLEKSRLLADLDEYKATFLPDDISDDEALKYYQPRLCQLPSELAEYTEQVTHQRMTEQEQLDLFKQAEDDLKKEQEEEEKKKKALTEELETLRKKVAEYESKK